MTRNRIRFALVLLCVTALAHTAFAQLGDQEPDPFMGDWQGTLTAPDGSEETVVAQVVCWGREGYQANILPGFDTRTDALAVLRGERDGDAVVFGAEARIEGGAFVGAVDAGTFEMAPVERLSDTLGLEPPEGAIVLFDGTDFSAWGDGGYEAYMIDLTGLPGPNNCVAYLRARVEAPEACAAMLQMGSDDGIKAWLNGVLVHGNNANRALRAFDDEVGVELQEGVNTLVLKIVQGQGGFGGCARIVGDDGAPLEGLKFDPMPEIENGRTLADYQGSAPGAIVTWELSGPYSEEGKAGAELFDVAFGPETDPEACVWTVTNDHPRPKSQWQIVDGAMQITPGSGAIATKEAFGDARFHLEFRTPFEPDRRGQSRGNSGIYFQARYEVQVLDSYGLYGYDNECGGIYAVSEPLVNMCAPPLQWQTYDVDFLAPRRDPDTGEVSDVRMTVRHSGVLIHDDVRQQAQLPEGVDIQLGCILLQDHGNPVQFRNIWVVPQ